MTKPLAAATFALTSALALGLSGAKEPPAQPRLDKLSWLAGDWSADGLTVHYTTPAGGKLLGVTKVMQGDTCPFFEFEVFEQRGEDLIVQPYPGGKPAASFTLESLDGRRAVFANEKNDWPQRIEYSRPDDDHLQFTLSAERDGKRRAETYRLKRTH